MDRRVTPPKRVTSPTWSPPPPRKQALIVLIMERVSVNNSSEGEEYTSEIWRSTLESNGLLAESRRQVTQTDAIANTPPKSGAFLVAFFFTSDFTTGEFGLSKRLLEIFIEISGETMCRLIVAVTSVLPVSVISKTSQHGGRRNCAHFKKNLPKKYKWSQTNKVVES